MGQADVTPRQKLGDFLVQRGIISADELDVALWEQGRKHRLLGEILLELGFVKEDTFYPLLAEFLGYSYVDLSQTLISHEAFSLLSPEVGNQLGVVAYKIKNGTAFLAISDPENIFIKQKISQILGEEFSLKFELASLKQILNCYQGGGRKSEPSQSQTEVEGVFQRILEEAVTQNASDIHFIPEMKITNVYYRIDGLLQKNQTFHTEVWQKLIVYIKLISRLDIAETRKPQDGRFDTVIAGESIDCRLSVIPTIHTESIVIRLLRKEKEFLTLTQLGFGECQVYQMRHLVSQPQGLILIAGPTGAGKSTTLYALLSEIDCLTRNVVTIEDPVEYIIPGIRQSELQGGGLKISDTLRALLRHDPDVIYISEIRDSETAKLAIQASLTGHLVLATIHATNVFSIPLRLKELGLDPLSLSNSLLGMMSQRLVRKLCKECLSAGCEGCHQTGYKGRTVIAEILEMKGALKDLLLTTADYRKLSAAIKEQGGRMMVDSADDLIASQITDVKEIKRVLGDAANV